VANFASPKNTGTIGHSLCPNILNPAFPILFLNLSVFCFNLFQ